MFLFVCLFLDMFKRENQMIMLFQVRMDHFKYFRGARFLRILLALASLYGLEGHINIHSGSFPVSIEGR